MTDVATILNVLERIREDGAAVTHRIAELGAVSDVHRGTLKRIERKQDKLEERIRQLETATAGSSRAQEIGGKVALVFVGALSAWLVSAAMG